MGSIFMAGPRRILFHFRRLQASGQGEGTDAGSLEHPFGMAGGGLQIPPVQVPVFGRIDPLIFVERGPEMLPAVEAGVEGHVRDGERAGLQQEFGVLQPPAVDVFQDRAVLVLAEQGAQIGFVDARPGGDRWDLQILLKMLIDILTGQLHILGTGGALPVRNAFRQLEQEPEEEDAA